MLTLKDPRNKQCKSETPTRIVARVGVGITKKNEHDKENKHLKNKVLKTSPKRILFVRSRHHPKTLDNAKTTPVEQTKTPQIQQIKAPSSRKIQTPLRSIPRKKLDQCIQKTIYINNSNSQTESCLLYYADENDKNTTNPHQSTRKRTSLETLRKSADQLSIFTAKRHTVGECMPQVTPFDKSLAQKEHQAANGQPYNHIFHNYLQATAKENPQYIPKKESESAKKVLQLESKQSLTCQLHPQKEAKYRQIIRTPSDLKGISYFEGETNKYVYCCSKCAVQLVTKGEQVEQIVQLKTVQQTPSYSTPVSDSKVFYFMPTCVTKRAARLTSLLQKIDDLMPKSQLMLSQAQGIDNYVRGKYQMERMKVGMYFEEVRRIVENAQKQILVQIEKCEEESVKQCQMEIYRQQIENLQFMDNDIRPYFQSIVDPQQLEEEKFQSIIRDHEETIAQFNTQLKNQTINIREINLFFQPNYIRNSFLEGTQWRSKCLNVEDWQKECQNEGKKTTRNDKGSQEQFVQTFRGDGLRMSFGNNWQESPKFNQKY